MAEIQARDYTQGSRNALQYSKSFDPLQNFFQSLIQNKQAKDLETQKGEQSQEQEKLKSYLQGQAQEQSLKRLGGLMENAPEGSGAAVTPEGGSYTKGYNPYQAQQRATQGDAQARLKANSTYNAGLPKVQQ